MLGSWVRGLPVHVFRTNHRETRVSVLGTACNQLRAAHVELVDGANEAFSGLFLDLPSLERMSLGQKPR